MTHPPPRVSPPEAKHAPPVALSRELVRLEARLLGLEKAMRPAIERLRPDLRESARNLVHYVALRQHDLRDLQVKLSQRGLSSLGRSESCVLASVLEVSARVQESLALRGHSRARRELARLNVALGTAVSWQAAQAALHRHTHEVLGPRPADRHIYIMTTAPPAAEATRAWMATMLRAGMNVLRINCAHEGEQEWRQLIEALVAARRGTGRECRVLMDLAGPKIRTGPIGGAPLVATWKPAKDELGRVKTPARVVIRRRSAPPPDDARPFLRMSDRASRRCDRETSCISATSGPGSGSSPSERSTTTSSSVL